MIHIIIMCGNNYNYAQKYLLQEKNSICLYN